MEEVSQVLVKRHWYDNWPKWLKVIFLIISIITLIYWIGFMIYKILSAIRVIGAFVFDKRNYWTFLVCILILIVGSIVVAQFFLGLDPIGKMELFIVEKWEELREYLGNIVSGG